jgi:hypothetical protein
LLACGGDDDDADGSGGAGTARPTATTAPVPTPTPAPAAVTVVLREWAVEPDSASVPAGHVTFTADNQGPIDPHELVIIRTDLSPDALPIVDDRVPEDQVDIIGEIEPIDAGTQESATFELEAGSYALICNIAELEEGQIESHYQLGMFTAFTVE